MHLVSDLFFFDTSTYQVDALISHTPGGHPCGIFEAIENFSGMHASLSFVEHGDDVEGGLSFWNRPFQYRKLALFHRLG